MIRDHHQPRRARRRRQSIRRRGPLFIERLETRRLLAGSPSIQTARSIVYPAAADPVWVTSSVSSTSPIADVSLTYGQGGGSPAFTETFGSSVVKPWDGTGANNAWTVSPSNPFQLATAADYQAAANNSGLQFNCKGATSASLTTTNAIATVGLSATVQFWVYTKSQTASDGWSFQVDTTGTGNNFVTCLSESNNTHAFQQYTYALTGNQLTSALKLRFVFSGGGGTDAGIIDVDQVTVSVATATTTAMLDDGAHHDGGAGDGVYGAQVPAMAAGTTVSYYVTAVDGTGSRNVDPAAAPGTMYSYTVRAVDTAPTLLGTSQTPEMAGAPVWITTNASDQSALTAVQLSYDAGSGTVTTAMLDDGAHEDGAAGDGLFGAAIPALPAGTKVRYSVSAANDVGLTAVDPVIAPTYRYSYTVRSTLNLPFMHALPGGTFEMGDHFNRVDPNHPSDEIPVHAVTVDAFKMGKFVVTNVQYVDYLNSALAQGLVRVQNGLIYGAGPLYGVGSTAYGETRQGQLALYNDTNPPLVQPYSGVSWNGVRFSVVAGQRDMPVVGVYWDGAVAYTNWLSATVGLQQCYTYTYDAATSTATWACDFTKSGYRLPTEAEWEYAANGGRTDPYYAYPWGNDPNTDGSYANTMGSGSPYAQYEAVNVPGAVYPWATPVGFYNGELHLKSDFNWPGPQASFQTSNAVNGFGLYDVTGNVWQWTNDWFYSQYYSVSPSNNPTGPATPGALAYHTLRGGGWAHYVHEATVSNRNPSINREPLHDKPYASVGFRVALKSPSPEQPGVPVVPVASTLQAGRGVAADAAGNVYFADAATDTIYKLSTAGQITTFQGNVSGLAGLEVDARGNVVALQNSPARVVSISPAGARTVLASGIDGVPFNSLHALWIDPRGGIFLTDPVASAQQAGGVYYIAPDRTSVTRVATGLVQPKGIVGSIDGTTLYVSDAATNATYAFSITGGVASNKRTFVARAASAIDIDQEGNLFLAADAGVFAYSPTGSLLATVPIEPAGGSGPRLPAAPVGLAFGGVDRRAVYVTTQTGMHMLATSTQGVTVNGAPTISGATREIVNPQSTDAVWVSANIVDDGWLSTTQLSYTIGGTGLSTVQFTETMSSVATAARKSWDGTNADNPWVVTQPTGKSYVAQVADANHGGGNTNGLRFSNGTSNVTDTMVTAPNPIDTSGSAATIEFYMECGNNSASQTIALQVNGGGGWETVFSETNSKHTWQKYAVSLTASQRSANMLMRFAFSGNGVTDAVDIDDITVRATLGTTTVVPMFDDGTHHDGAAGDGVFGVQIPALATNSVVCYRFIATDDTGKQSVDPFGAPYYHTYKVGQQPSAVSFNEVLANAKEFVPTLDYPTKNIGLLTSSNVGANSAGGVADGYMLVPAMSGSTAYLIDTQGRIINQWVSSYTSTGRSVLLTREGDLIRSNSLPGSENPVDGENVGGVIEKFNWQGDRVGYFVFAGTNTQDGTPGLGFAQHHNIMVMPNGNILMSTVQSYTPAQALAAGFNQANLFGGTTVLVDGIVEVKPDWANHSFSIVWQWSFWNHLVQTTKPDGYTFYTNSAGQTVYVNNYASSINNPYKLNANFNGQNTPILARLFTHDNGLDYNPVLDQIAISARVTNEIYIIDHSTTSDEAATGSGGRYGRGGDFLYRWGNPAIYGAPGNQTLFMQHNVQWVQPGMPGAGNLTVMNNGNNRPGSDPRYTVISEITPPLNPDGTYALMANGAYGPLADSWTYTDTPPTAFYNSDGGGAQRLPNGDTLISFDTQGLAFEVTADGKINWQFQNGNAGSKGATQNSDVILFQGDDLPPDYNLPGGYTTTVYNFPWYPADYFTFTNQRLVGTGTIEQYRTWVELYNASASPVNLAGMYLSTSNTAPTMWRIPAGNVIPANGHLVFYCDGQTTSTQAAGRHTNFTLSAAGGSVYLFDTNGITPLAAIAYPSAAADKTFGSPTDGAPGVTPLATPSPGWTNGSTPPTAIGISSATVLDHQPLHTVVGVLSTTSAHPFDTFTYALVPGPGGEDNASFAIVGGNTLETAAVFVSSVRNSYSIRVRSTNARGQSIERTLTIAIAHADQPPAFAGTQVASPALPNLPVVIRSTITDEQGLTAASLSYANYSQLVSSTPFVETFGAAAGAWSGVADQTWTIAGGTSPFKLATSANYQTSSRETGVQFTASKATSATLTSAAVNVAAAAARISFWIKTQSLTASDGWALQIDPTGSGNNFTTCRSETGVDHTFTLFSYTLTDAQRVANLLIRFAFTGGGTGDAGIIQVDQVAVTVDSYPAFTTVPMYDDGAHGDAAAGDGVYAATIPGQASGSSIKYYVGAANRVGLSSLSPASGAAAPFGYTVQANQAPTAVQLSSTAIAENAGVDAVVGTFTTTDANAGDVFTYALVVGTGSDDNATFNISDNRLRAAASLDYETRSSYSVRVRATDANGLFTEQSFSVTVVDVVERWTMLIPDGSSVSDSVAHAGSSQLVKQGPGRLILDAANSHTGGVAVEAGELVVRNVGAIGAGRLVVGPGAKVTFDVGSRGVALSDIDIQSGGLLDIGFGRVTLAAGTYDLGVVRQRLVAGCAGGAWAGTSGIVSTRAAAIPGRAVGHAIDGSGNLVVGFAAPGDLNLDGVIDFDDVFAFVSAGKYDTGSAATWAQGDFDYNGVVDFDDVFAMVSTSLYDRGSYLPAESLSLSLSMGSAPTTGDAVVLGSGQAVIFDGGDTAVEATTAQGGDPATGDVSTALFMSFTYETQAAGGTSTKKKTFGVA